MTKNRTNDWIITGEWSQGLEGRWLCACFQSDWLCPDWTGPQWRSDCRAQWFLGMWRPGTHSSGWSLTDRGTAAEGAMTLLILSVGRTAAVCVLARKSGRFSLTMNELLRIRHGPDSHICKTLVIYFCLLHPISLLYLNFKMWFVSRDIILTM